MGQYRDKRKPEARTMPYSFFQWLQVFFLVHITIDSTVQSMHLNSLEQYHDDIYPAQLGLEPGIPDYKA